MPLEKMSDGRTPVERVLIITGDAGEARDVFAIFEIGCDVVGKTAEFVPEIQEEVMVEAVKPIDARVDSERVGGVEEIEEARGIGTHALEGESPVDLVFETEGFVEARLQRVLMRGADERNLIVVSGARSEVRQWIEIEQGSRLRTDAAGWNSIAGEWQSSGGIENLRRGLGEIPATLGGIGHQTGLRSGVAVSRPLIADEDVGTVLKKVRNAQRATEGE